MNAELQKLINENTCLKKEIDACNYNLKSLIEGDNRVEYYIGLPRCHTLKILLNLTESIIINLWITLMKLHLNLDMIQLTDLKHLRLQSLEYLTLYELKI